MEVHLTPDLQAKVDQWASDTGRPPGELLADVMAGYFADLAQLRDTLDSRYDDLKNGSVAPIDGEAYFEKLREREEELLPKRTR